MRGCLFLGRYLGIRLLVHWSFIFILLWVGWLGWSEGGWLHCLWSQVLILLLFVCVVLHEFGHSVVAMRFGVSVNTIMLLPIGGVAAMSTIPKKPIQEFLIAVAGPAVNVVIVVGLGIGTGRWLPDVTANLFPTTIPALLDKLLLINLVLIAFNLLPAFPMDGGRILRSLLAMVLTYARATQIAVWIGQGMAVLFLWLGLTSGNPFLILIALFVFFGAAAENRAVRMQEAFQGVRAQDVMHRVGTLLSPLDSLDRCSVLQQQDEQADFLVVEDDRLVGILDQRRWQSARRTRGRDTSVAQVMRSRFTALGPDAPMSDTWRDLLQNEQRVFPVVEGTRILGMITPSDMVARMVVSGIPVPRPPASVRAGRTVGRSIDLG